MIVARFFLCLFLVCCVYVQRRKKCMLYNALSRAGGLAIWAAWGKYMSVGRSDLLLFHGWTIGAMKSPHQFIYEMATKLTVCQAWSQVIYTWAVVLDLQKTFYSSLPRHPGKRVTQIPFPYSKNGKWEWKQDKGKNKASSGWEDRGPSSDIN